MDSGDYVCYALDYSTLIWWNFDDDTITDYSGYPENFYDNWSNENEQKKGKNVLWMDHIGLYQCYM